MSAAARRRSGRLVPTTLRMRISVLAALAVLATLAVAGVALVWAQRLVLTENLDEALARQADVVLQQVRTGRSLDSANLLFEDVAVAVDTAAGEVVAAVPPGVDELLPRGGAAGGQQIATVEVGERAVRLLSRESGDLTVRVAGSLDDVDESTTALVAGLAVAVPSATALLAAVVWWAVGRALAPVEGIRAQVDSISGSRLDRRVSEPAAPREIGLLARTMNAMLARLQRSAEQQRRFVADASHELRSPLARMRAELEVDAAHPGSADPAATAASVLAEAVALQRLVDDLLLLARGDAGAMVPARVLLDLDEVVADQARLARASGADIDESGVRPVQVRGDPGQLERAVSNLVENAVRHARSGVRVTLGHEAGRAVLAVSDDGPGIAPADRARVFERFTRLDPARSVADGGAGLGLAIARDIVQRHGGTLTVADAPLGGARLVIELPAEPGDTDRG